MNTVRSTVNPEGWAGGIPEAAYESESGQSRLKDFFRGTLCAACAAFSTTVSVPFRNLGIVVAAVSAALILCCAMLRTEYVSSQRRRRSAAGWMFLPMLVLSGFVDLTAYRLFSPKGGGPDLLVDAGMLVILYIPAAFITMLLAFRLSGKYARKQEAAGHRMTPEESHAESKKTAANAAAGLFGCILTGIAAASVENFVIYLFLPLVIICGVLLPLLSRSKKCIAAVTAHLLRAAMAGMYGFLTVCTVVTQLKIGQNSLLYPLKRFSYLTGTVAMDSDRTLLPASLPAAHDDYFFSTKPTAHPMDGEPHRQAFLFMHTDDETIRQYEALLAEKGYTGELNLKCSEERLEELREDYADAYGEDVYCFQEITQKFPNRIYRVLTENGVLHEDLSHAVIYPHVLINKETNLLIIWVQHGNDIDKAADGLPVRNPESTVPDDAEAV